MLFATDFEPADSSSRHPDDSQHAAASQVQSQLQSQFQKQKTAKTTALNSHAVDSYRSTARSTMKSVKLETTEVAIAVRGLSKPTVSELAVSELATSKPAVIAPSVVRLPLRVKPALPLWLKILNHIQHGSTVVTSLLIAGALVLYGSSVYVDKSASRAMARLNQLQGESQQLTTANESIKQSLAEQAAQENSGLEPYESGDVLFVTPEPARATTELPPELSEAASTRRPKPLGY